MDYVEVEKKVRLEDKLYGYGKKLIPVFICLLFIPILAISGVLIAESKVFNDNLLSQQNNIDKQSIDLNSDIVYLNIIFVILGLFCLLFLIINFCKEKLSYKEATMTSNDDIEKINIAQKEQIKVPWGFIEVIKSIIYFVTSMLLFRVFLLLVSVENEKSIMRSMLDFQSQVWGELLCIFIIVYMISKISKNYLAELGLKLKSLPGNIGWGIVFFLASIPVVLLAANLNTLIIDEAPGSPLDNFFTMESDIKIILLLSFSVVFVIPFFEELFFRGILLPVIRNYLGSFAAIFFSAALFAVIHPMNSWLPILVLGIFFGLLFEKTKSLYACWVMHLLNNGFYLIVIMKGIQ